MPPTAIHGITGILIGSITADQYFRFGAILGSLWPDADLLASSIVYLLTGDVDSAKKVHRTFTHSLVVHLSLAGIGLILLYGIESRFGIFLLSMAGMMAIHTLMDYVYIAYMCKHDLDIGTMPGVALFAPLSMKKFALFSRVFSDRVYKVFLTTDLMADPVFLYGPMLYFAWCLKSDQYIWWLVVGVSLFFLIITVFFLALALFCKIHMNTFIVSLYCFCIFCLIFTLIIPFLFWQTFQQLNLDTLMFVISAN